MQARGNNSGYNRGNFGGANSGGAGGVGGGGSKKARKTGPYHQLITAKDLEEHPLCWSGMSLSSVNGTPHVHAMCDFVDANCRGDFTSSAQLLIPGDEDPQRWIKVVDQCIVDGLIPQTLRDSYIAKASNVARDMRLTNELSALVVLPGGDKTGYSLKNYIGLSVANGQKPELTIHHRIEKSKMKQLVKNAADFLDANPEFKRKFLSDGLKDKSQLKALLEKPTIELIVDPVQQSRYKEDQTDPNTGVLLHEAGDLIESDPDIMSFRPTVSYLDKGGDKSTTPGPGCFAFNYKDVEDDSCANAIWWSPTIVPTMDENGRVVGQKFIEHILEEREWMYCSKDNVNKDYAIRVGEKPFFTIRGNVLKYGLPMLHSSEGKIKFIFFVGKAMFLSKNIKTGDAELTKSVNNMNMAALLATSYADEEEEKEDEEGVGHSDPVPEPEFEDHHHQEETSDDRSKAPKRSNPFETQQQEQKSLIDDDDDDVLVGGEDDEGSEDSAHSIAQKKKSTTTNSKKGTTKHQHKKQRS